MQIIRIILTGLWCILITVIGLGVMIIGYTVDICFEIFRTIRYWGIAGLTLIVKKVFGNSKSRVASWNHYIDGCLDSDVTAAYKLHDLKIDY